MSPTTTNARPRLKERYLTEIRPALQSELGLGNVMQVPRVEKIVLNCGVGRATQQQSLLDGAVTDLGIITGQKPLVTRARKSIATFKLREGNAIGAKVTLRGDRMWEFYDRLVSVAIPRIRDFRGLNPDSFDGRGNYTFGVTEQLIFPEIDYDKIDTVRGMDITIVTTAATRRRGPSAPPSTWIPLPPRRAELEEPAHGKEGTRPEAAAHTEVQGARLHPVPPVWPGALGVQALRSLPHLLAPDGARGRGPRRHEGVLVTGTIRKDACVAERGEEVRAR